MNFEDLRESLRAELQRRVDDGRITASSLARQTGFKQAHISNFLNRRRSLSLAGLDRVLAAQQLSVDQILPLEIRGAAGPYPGCSPVPVVAPSTAMDDPVVATAAVMDTLYVPELQLANSEARPARRFEHWQRYLAIRVGGQEAAAMGPMLTENSVAVLDRHQRSLTPQGRVEQTLYAVRTVSGLALRFVEFEESRLVLRPVSLAFPVQLISLMEEQSAADYLVGRVCLVLHQL